MSEQNEKNKNLDSQEESNSSEVVEVPWEEVSQIFETRQLLAQTDEYLSDFLLQHEKEKMRLLRQSTTLQGTMYSLASGLRESLSLDSETPYELKLPTEAGEKAYFIRKDN